jgi:hypothetical protein
LRLLSGWLLHHLSSCRHLPSTFNFSGRIVIDYANPNEVALLLTKFWGSIYESSQIQFLCIDFDHAIAVGCGKPMPLKGPFPLQFLDGEASLWMKLSQVGCHKKALVIMWGYTQLLR